MSITGGKYEGAAGSLPKQTQADIDAEAMMNAIMSANSFTLGGKSLFGGRNGRYTDAQGFTPRTYANKGKRAGKNSLEQRADKPSTMATGYMDEDRIFSTGKTNLRSAMPVRPL